MRDSNVVKLAPISLCNSQQDVIDNIHGLADEIAAGDFGEVKTVITIIETMDGQLTHQTNGERCDLARVVGLMTMEMIRFSTETE